MPVKLGLDIDESIAATAATWAKDMIPLFGNPENLTPKELMDRYGIIQNVPYWKENAEAKKWIDAKIADAENLLQVEPMHEALKVLNSLLSEGVRVEYYVTARSERTRDATKRWLDMHDFPKAEVIHRPKDMDHSVHVPWKAGIIKELFPKVNAFVDDRADIAKELPADYRGRFFVLSRPGAVKIENQHNFVVSLSTWAEIGEGIKGYKRDLLRNIQP